MTTAEKRSALAAAGEPWPTCDCHGRPMGWQRDPKLTAGGRFRCRNTIDDYRTRGRQRRRDAGLCVWCTNPADTESLCRTCADRHADTAASAGQVFKHRASQARYRARRRSGEGFQPTQAGRAAIAAWMTGE